MAEKPKASVAGEPAAATQEQEEQQPVFSVEELVDQSRRLFGVSPHIAAGALSKGGRKNYSESEAAQRVEEFAKTEIEL